MTGIEKIQAIELDILKQVLEILKKHDLTYYMLGGTLLGAVRHQGFIPWDDDIDIGLPRPDYERFLTCARRELSAPYRLHDIREKDSDYCYYYARVENTDFRLLRSAALKQSEVYVWIDIFPLDGVPSDEEERNRWLKSCRKKQLLFNYSQFSYYGAASERKTGKSGLKKFLRNAAFQLQLEKLISTEWCWKRLDKALKKYDFDQCSKLINFCGHWGVKEMFDKSVYGAGRQYRFEDIMLNGPENYDFVLTQMYGDYMTPPPDADKDQHFVCLLDDPKPQA